MLGRACWVALAVTSVALAGCPGRTVDPVDASLPDVYIAPVIDAGTDAGALECEAGEVDCDGVCTRTAGDSLNCGACGNACPLGVSCAVGRCDCERPRISCDGLCLDPSADPMNCGSCGNVCTGEQMCVGGECIVMCVDPNVICTNQIDGKLVPVCADLQTSAANCGGCNTQCAGGAVCTAGRCQCPSTQLNCDGTCTDVDTDAMNCGSCGVSCGEGGVCVDAECTTCGTGLTECGGRCVNVMTDTFNCGSCDRGCGLGEGCSGGLCECVPGRVDCGTGCTDQLVDTRNCGACGTNCGIGGVCTTGVCTCAAGYTMCGTSCFNLMRDRTNCGTCGTACAMGESCQTGVCLPATGFRVTTLGTTNCTTVDHLGATGDDHGGIAISGTHLFVTGDTATARMSATDLTGTASVGAQHAALFSDLDTEQVYVLLTATGTEPDAPATVTQLGLLDGATGALTAGRVALSTPIPLMGDWFGDALGIFSGFGGVVLGNPVGTSMEWWHIELPSGVVTRLGNTQIPSFNYCESWAIWGIAEIDVDVHSVVFADGDDIVRLTLPAAGMSSTAAPVLMASFTDLSNMCSLTISTSRDRWFFHHEYSSQFVSTGDEVAGSCDAVWDRL